MFYLSKINKDDSFYVGDALGRPGDHADSDKQFAINCGIKYISPEQMFPGQIPQLQWFN